MKEGRYLMMWLPGFVVEDIEEEDEAKDEDAEECEDDNEETANVEDGEEFEDDEVVLGADVVLALVA
jgi:hypothetical protein